MNKPRFKVGDLVFWRGEGEALDDVGLTIEIFPCSPKWGGYYVRVLWLASEDPIGRFGETHPSLRTQQEWKDRKNEQR
jgi:hypothetical protein